jgi:uncharacterized membrane protein
MTAEAELEAEVQGTAAERLVFFSDAVIAIAITLLALELPVPEGHTASEVRHSLGEHFDSYLAFLISFAVIGTQWLAHHAVFRYVNRMSRRLGQLDLLWLLTVVVTPFATDLLVSDAPFAVAFTFYSGVQAAAALIMVFIVLLIRRSGFTRPGTPDGYYRRLVQRSLGFVAGFLVAIPVAYWTHWAYAVWWAVPNAIGLAWRRLESRRRPEARRSAG